MTDLVSALLSNPLTRLRLLLTLVRRMVGALLSLRCGALALEAAAVVAAGTNRGPLLALGAASSIVCH